MPDYAHAELNEWLRKVLVPSAPIVHRLRNGEAEPLSDFGSTDDLFRVDLARHAVTLRASPRSGGDDAVQEGRAGGRNRRRRASLTQRWTVVTGTLLAEAISLAGLALTSASLPKASATVR